MSFPRHISPSRAGGGVSTRDDEALARRKLLPSSSAPVVFSSAACLAVEKVPTPDHTPEKLLSPLHKDDEEEDEELPCAVGEPATHLLTSPQTPRIEIVCEDSMGFDGLSALNLVTPAISGLESTQACLEMLHRKMSPLGRRSSVLDREILSTQSYFDLVRGDPPRERPLRRRLFDEGDERAGGREERELLSAGVRDHGPDLEDGEGEMEKTELLWDPPTVGEEEVVVTGGVEEERVVVTAVVEEEGVVVTGGVELEMTMEREGTPAKGEESIETAAKNTEEMIDTATAEGGPDVESGEGVTSIREVEGVTGAWIQHSPLTGDIIQPECTGICKVASTSSEIASEGLRKEHEEGLRKEREEGLRKEREEGLRKEREEGMRKEREEGLKKEREEGLRTPPPKRKQGARLPSPPPPPHRKIHIPRFDPENRIYRRPSSPAGVVRYQDPESVDAGSGILREVPGTAAQHLSYPNVISQVVPIPIPDEPVRKRVGLMRRHVRSSLHPYITIPSLRIHEE